MTQPGVEGYRFTPEQFESEVSDLEAAAAGLVAGFEPQASGSGGGGGTPEASQSEALTGDRIFMTGMPNADPAGYLLPPEIQEQVDATEAELRVKGIDPESEEGVKELRRAVGFQIDQFVNELTESLL